MTSFRPVYLDFGMGAEPTVICGRSDCISCIARAHLALAEAISELPRKRPRTIRQDMEVTFNMAYAVSMRAVVTDMPQDVLSDIIVRTRAMAETHMTARAVRIALGEAEGQPKH